MTREACVILQSVAHAIRRDVPAEPTELPIDASPPSSRAEAGGMQIFLSDRKARKNRGPKPRPPDVSDLTDEGNARRFVDKYAPVLRYCHGWLTWLEYDGKRWCRDNTLAQERMARESIQSLREPLPRLKAKDRPEFEAGILRSESLRTMKAMIGMAKSDLKIAIRPDEFDRNPLEFNCSNGTIDLTTGAIRSHDPDDKLTKLSPVEYVPAAPCPTWDAFLSRTMGGDEEWIGYLRRAAGYALTGNVSSQCLFLLHGHGRNGKTVLLNALLHVLGDYGMTAPNNLLTSAGQQQHPSALADLDGMRFVAITEPSGGCLDEALVKWLTGEDAIRARRMHCDSYEFQPSHKFFMASNHKPEIRETGLAIWRRIRLILFAVTIPLDEVDSGLPDKLRGEASGILNWMVRGCLEWQASGLDEPEKVRRATTDYREEMDPIKAFLSACCVKGEDLRARSSELWAAYLLWSSNQDIPLGERIANDTQFGKLLTDRGITGKKTGGIMVRLGIALKPTVETEAS